MTVDFADDISGRAAERPGKWKPVAVYAGVFMAFAVAAHAFITF